GRIGGEGIDGLAQIEPKLEVPRVELLGAVQRDRRGAVGDRDVDRLEFLHGRQPTRPRDIAIPLVDPTGSRSRGRVRREFVISWDYSAKSRTRAQPRPRSRRGT